MAKDETTKKKSKIRTLIKWFRRITLIAGIVAAVRRYQAERNSQIPPHA